jgi:hypothetical protein
LACSLLDAVEEYSIADGDVPGLLVLHGLAMYARDTARAALALLADGQTLAAAALTRVVIEHAVLAQWLKVDSETRGSLFLQQGEVDRHRWFDVVLAANFDLTDPVHAALTKVEERVRGPKRKNVAREFDTVKNLFGKNLFGDTDQGRQMYLTYRNLSQFVHPSPVTFARYTGELPHGLLLSTRLQVVQNADALAFYLACATTMCTLPYLDALDLSWLSLVRTLGEGVEGRLGLGRDAWLGCEALVADHDGRGA